MTERSAASYEGAHPAHGRMLDDFPHGARSIAASEVPLNPPPPAVGGSADLVLPTVLRDWWRRMPDTVAAYSAGIEDDGQASVMEALGVAVLRARESFRVLPLGAWQATAVTPGLLLTVLMMTATADGYERQAVNRMDNAHGLCAWTYELMMGALPGPLR